MEPRPVERKLAAILAADVAGYSRLMGADEEGTLAQLRAHTRTLVDPKIAQHRGKIVKTSGDGMLVEFASVMDALRCAVEIQRGMGERNAAVAAEKRLEFRIGLNLGDVIHEEGDIFGDGVNVAARLEALAEPGSICISRSVRDAVSDKLGLAFEDMGDQALKNIAAPVHTYRVRFGGDAPNRPAATRWWRYRYRAAAGTAAIWVLAAVALAVWSRRTAPPVPAPRAVAVQAASLPLPDKPSVAVLPFTNIGGDARQERLADGITEDVITDLSRYRDLFVIASNSVFTYKGKPVNVRQVGRDLGVRYVLEGSIQAGGDRVRVTAQLVEAASNVHVWSDRYDRPLDNIFDLQNEVTQKIAAALGGMSGRLIVADAASARRKPPTSLQAYDYYALGVEALFRSNNDDNLLAEKFLNKAIDLDPQFARAYMGLGRVYLFRAAWGWEDGRAMLEKGRRFEAKAIDLDPAEAMAYALLGEMSAYLGDLDRGLAAFEQALALNPNDPQILIKFGAQLGLYGRAQEGVAMIDRAFRLNPRYPDWYNNYPDPFYAAGQYDRAIGMVHRRLGEQPIWNYVILAMSCAQLGRQSEAALAVAEVVRRFPDFSLERVMSDSAGTAPRDPATLAHYLDGARKAGIRECATPGEVQKHPKMIHLAICDGRRSAN